MNGRRWTVEDLDQIAELERDCFPYPWTRRMLADSLLSGRFFGVLLEEDGAIVSYGGMTVLDEEAEIELIATAEMYRRCGRGEKMLASSACIWKCASPIPRRRCSISNTAFRDCIAARATIPTARTPSS